MRRLFLACCAVFVASCGDSTPPGELDCGMGGERVTAGEEDFCVYAGAGLEALIACPSQLPNVVEFATGLVCTGRASLGIDATPDEVCDALGPSLPPSPDELMCSALVSCRRGAACCEADAGLGCATSTPACVSTCIEESVFCQFPCEEQCEDGTIPCATGCCAGSIQLDIVDAGATANEGSESAVGVDGNGTVHIVFKRAGELVHAHNRSGSWSIEVIDDGGDPTEIRAEVEPNGLIHATYVIGTSPRYALYNGCNWSTEELPQRALDLAVDLADGPRILVGGEVLERTTPGWVRFGNELPDARDGVALDIDAIGQMHVTATEPPTPRLQYLVWDPAGWDAVQLAGNVPSPGDRFELDITTCGAVYATIANCTTESDLCVYDRSSNEFVTRPFGEGGRSVVFDHRMAVSADGIVHLVLVREPDLGDPRTVVTEYARWDGDAWRFVDLIGTSQTVGSGVSLSVDENGTAHIALFEDGLRYVRIN